MLNAWLAFRALPWKLIGYLALGLALAASLAALKIERSHTAKLQAQLTACDEGRKADRAKYEGAQDKAKAGNIEHVTNKENQQGSANDAQVRKLTDRIEQLRRELRPQAGAPGSHSGGPEVPEADRGPEAAGPSCVHLTPEELLRGAEDEERHAELVELVNQLIKITNE